MKDIKNRLDIILLVDTFYEKIKTDQTIGYFFIEVAKVDWNIHLSKMYDFWENILFYTSNYSGSPMQVHKELHQKSPLKAEHFDHWLTLFCNNIDEHFKGKKANEIKERAKNIAMVMSYKVLEKKE